MLWRNALAQIIQDGQQFASRFQNKTTGDDKRLGDPLVFDPYFTE
jgi:hypothetical protein